MTTQTCSSLINILLNKNIHKFSFFFFQIRVNALVCIGKLVEHMDKFMLVDEIFPMFQKIPSREPAVLMAMLGKYFLNILDVPISFITKDKPKSKSKDKNFSVQHFWTLWCNALPMIFQKLYPIFWEYYVSKEIEKFFDRVFLDVTTILSWL